MHRRKRTSRLWLKLSGAVLVFLVLIVAFVYAYDVPGGVSDWQYSRAAGYSETLNIPIGRTPEEAVQKFRNTSNQVVYQEHIDGGVLLFLKRYEQKENTNLQQLYEYAEVQRYTRAIPNRFRTNNELDH